MPKPIDWHRLLVDGYEPLKKAQRVFRRLPSDPRCKLCQNPFGGVGGKLCRVIGRNPSRKNPNLCLLSSELYQLVAPDHPGARTDVLQVKGRAEPVPVAILDVTARPA